MSEQFIPIEELPLRENPELKDNIMVESLDNPDVPTSRSPISEIKRLFTGIITQESDGFPEGHEIYEQFEALKAAANNICSWNREISELCTMELNEFIQLKYDCCLILSSVPDFPADLKESDASAYVFTNRNKNNAVQILIGATTGVIATRRMNNSLFTEWTYSNSKGISYATFSVRDRHLIMHTDPGYSGANFSIKNHHLIVTI